MPSEKFNNVLKKMLETVLVSSIFLCLFVLATTAFALQPSPMCMKRTRCDADNCCLCITYYHQDNFLICFFQKRIDICVRGGGILFVSVQILLRRLAQMKNNVKKRICLIMLAVIFVLSAALVAACKPDKPNPTPPGPNPPGPDDPTYYTVTFETVGGTAVKSVKVKKGETVSKPADPTKAGADFLGWFVSASGNEHYNFAAPVNSDLTLYAHWSDESYSVQFDVNGGYNLIEYQTKQYGQMLNEPAAPNRVGYSFGGWYTDIGLTQKATFPYTVKSDVNFYAKWTSDRDVTVNYKMCRLENDSRNIDYEQEILASQTVKAGSKLSQPQNPKDVQYTDGSGLTHTLKFSRWDFHPLYRENFTNAVLFPVTVKENVTEITLYAVYVEVGENDTYASLTIHPENGEAETVMYGVQGKKLAIAELNDNMYSPFYSDKGDPHYAGYKATGFYKTQDFNASQVYKVPFELTNAANDLYIRWEEAEDVTVTFSQGITGVANQQVKAPYQGKIIRPENPIRPGYTFDGWYRYDAPAVEEYRWDFDNSLIATGGTLIAKWVKTATVITYDTKGGYERNSIAVTQNASVSSLPTPVRQIGNTAYNFLGWYTDDDCQDAVTLPLIITDDVTLYAKWSDAIDLSKLRLNYIGGYYSVQVEPSERNNIAGKVVLPSYYAGLQVIRVETNGFKDCTMISDVEMPDTITYLYNSSFRGCTSLKKVTLSDRLVQIAQNSFSGCANLEEVNFPKGIYFNNLFSDVFSSCPKMQEKLTCDQNGIYYWENAVLGTEGAVKGTTAINNDLTEYTIKSGTTVIASGAFRTCYALETLTLADSVKFATFWAYPDDEKGSLKTLNLSKAYQDVPRQSTYYPRSLETITVPSDNLEFEVKEGCLIYRYENKLVASVKSATSIPEGVVIIAEQSFTYKELETVIIPSTVTTIRNRAFAGCKFTGIAIPDNVGILDEEAFYKCEQMETISLGAKTNRQGKGLFGSMTRLRQLSVSEKNASMRASDSVLYDKHTKEIIYAARAYNGRVTIWDGVTTIPENIFYGNYSEFIIPDSVTELEQECFAGWTAHIGKLVLGKNVPLVSASYLVVDDGFDTGIDSIELSPENPNMKSLNGCLYDYNMTKLLYAPTLSTELNLPDTVTEIDAGIFLPNLSAFHVGAGLTKDQFVKRIYGDLDYWKDDSRIVTSSVTVSENNTELASYKGVVYTKDKQHLVYIPAGFSGDLELPKEMTALTEYVVDYTSLWLPSTDYESLKYNSINVNTVKTEQGSVLESMGRYSLSKMSNYQDRPYWTENYLWQNNVTLSVREIDLSNSTRLTTIEEQAFSSLPITKVTLPASVNSIETFAFGACSKLSELNADLTNVALGDSAFYGCTELYDEDGWLIIDGMLIGISNGYDLYGLDLIIPENVHTIKSGTFTLCDARTITIPSTVTTVQANAIGIRQASNGLLVIYLEASEIPATYAEGWYSSSDSYPVKVVTNCKENNPYYIDPTTGLRYELHSEDKTATLIDSYSITEAVTGDYTLEGTITVGDAVYTVTEIYPSAFGDRKVINGVTGLTIPDTVTKIGDNAFSMLKDLTSVTVPDSVVSMGTYVFANLKELQTVSLGSGITVIPDCTFRMCQKLTTVTAKAEITSIGKQAFYECLKLESLFDVNSVKTVGQNAFYKCESITELRFSDALTSVEGTAFQNCTGLTTVTLGNNIEAIEARTFENCSSLTYLAIPASVKSIGLSAVKGCTSLTSLTVPFVGDKAENPTKTYFGWIFGANGSSGNASALPASLKTLNILNDVTIAKEAFYGCKYLETINGTTFNGIGKQAFAKCVGLKALNVVINGAVAEQAFYDFDAQFAKITEITFGDGLKSVGAYGVGYLPELTKITFGASKNVNIGQQAFYNNVKLSQIVFDDEFSIGTLGKWSFGLAAITEIKLPKINGTLGASIFYNCKLLEKVTLPNAYVAIDYENAFSGCSKLVLNEYANARYIGTVSNPYAMLVDVIDVTATEIEINSATEYINRQAFAECSKLTSITIPSSVKVIGSSAFYGLSGLLSVTFDNCADIVIKDSAFDSCSSLSQVSFNNCTVKEIGDWAFADTNIAELTLPVTEVMGEEVFYGLTLTLDVPYEENNLPSTWSDKWGDGAESIVIVYKANAAN